MALAVRHQAHAWTPHRAHGERDANQGLALLDRCLGGLVWANTTAGQAPTNVGTQHDGAVPALAISQSIRCASCAKPTAR
jgi:hypothetical protein